MYSSFAHGISIKFLGLNINTQSYTDIAKMSQDLVNKRNELEKKNNTEYPQAISRQQTAEAGFRSSKAEYEELALQASPADIRKANQREEYLLDYLWMKIGTYANIDDVKVRITPVENESRIYFDVSGPYIAVINFIYDLEHDEDLEFNIDNVVMQGGSSAEITNASFFVGNINVVTVPTVDVPLED